MGAVSHGCSNTKLYGVWCGMKSRCEKEYIPEYESYGGRGITVCDEWKRDFIKFKEWAVENGYSNGLQIDRIDVNGNYCPDNCRFVTPMENSNNRRNNKRAFYKNKKATIAELCRENNVPYLRVISRLRAGWTIDDAIEKPVDKRRKRKRNAKENDKAAVSFDKSDGNEYVHELKRIRAEKGMTALELSKLSGVPRQTISAIENNKKPNITIRTLSALANALEVKISDLF